MAKTLKEVEKLINLKRIELNSNIEKYGIGEKKVQLTSEEMDILIVEYMKLKSANKNL